MLKLSKISKVFLSAGLLLAFSGFVNIAYAGEYETCLHACEKNTKDKKIEKCKQKCDEAEKARQQKADLLGTGGWESSQKSSTQIVATDANGEAMAVRTKTGERTQDANGQKLVKDNNGNYTRADGSSVSQWEQASLKKNDAQEEYTKASVEYNKCVARKGAAECMAQQKTMNEAKSKLDSTTQEYNQVQKEASKAYYENQKAQAKADKAAEKAEAAALKADQKELKNAEKELDKINKEINKCKKKAADDAAKQACEDAHKAELEAAQGKVDSAKDKVDAHNKAVESTSNGSADVGGKSSAEIGRELDKINLELKQAEADCEKYSAMTSKDAQSKAKEACAKATQLESRKNQLEIDYANAEGTNEAKYSGNEAASTRLRTTNADYSANGTGYGVVDISQSRELKDISYKGVGEGYNFNYANGSDALETVTRRAALAIVGLKPIVYVFAGFGLIAFAWMAIFGKLSWKWFANIAMGLFLVANMGRFIEYFVAGGSDYHYYVGEWKSGTDGSKGNQLANAFHDIYYVYGDTTYNAKGLRNYVDEKDIESTIASDVFTPNARGFCQGTSASGWANFTSCMKDIVASGKKAVDAVKTGMAVVEDVKARIETVKDVVSNIKAAAENMGNIHSLSDVINNTGIILGNVNTAVSTTTGAVGSLTNAASRISNDVQDLGKSVEQQKELEDRRALGEATNAFDAKLKGQEFNKTTGGVEKVDGQYAGEKSTFTTIQDAANKIGSKAETLNGYAQTGLAQAGAVTDIAGNLSLNDITLGLSQNRNTINGAIQDKQEAKAQAKNEAENERRRAEYAASNEGKNAAYRTQVNETNRLYSDMKAQENEVRQLQYKKTEAEKTKKKACDSDANSALCKAATAQVSSLDDALNNKQTQLATTQGSYELAKERMASSYQESLNSNIEEAQKAYDAAEKRANDACAVSASSSECASARKMQMQAASQLVSYTNERDNKTNENLYTTKEQTQRLIDDNPETQARKREEEKLKYEREQEELRLKTEAAQANQAYERTMDEVNTLYTQLNAQKNEVKNLEAEAENKKAAAKEACAKDKDSAVCSTSRIAVQAANAALENKKNQVKQTESRYNTEKEDADKAYNRSVVANINQAQRDYSYGKSQMSSSEEIIKETTSKLPTAKTEAEKAQKAYDKAKTEAMKAQEAYEGAVSKGKNDEEIAKLKAEYEAKLAAMTRADQNNQQKSSTYRSLQQQKAEAEKSYNEAYEKVNDAGARLASYTNERDNRTKETKKTSTEENYTQELINQYNRENSPTAIAQASKNNYIQLKNDADSAGEKIKEKKAVVDEAKRAYEAAKAKADQTGLDEDRRIAERQKKNYDLAVEEFNEAQKEYDKIEKEANGYEKTYLNNAINAEKYKQQTYQAQMQKASADINTYEKQVSSLRKTAEDLRTKYTKAKAEADKGGKEATTKAAEIYAQYKDVKALYETAQKNLSGARRDFKNAQIAYQESEAEQKRLETQIKNK